MKMKGNMFIKHTGVTKASDGKSIYVNFRVTRVGWVYLYCGAIKKIIIEAFRKRICKGCYED